MGNEDSSQPLLDPGVDLLPAAQVEVTDTAVRVIGEVERLIERGEQLLIDVIKDTGHVIAAPETRPSNRQNAPIGAL